MKCADAQAVWSHPDGFIAGLKARLPGVLERLEKQTENFKNGVTNPFHEGVKHKAGEISREFYVEHAEDDDPIARQVHDVVGDTAARLELQAYLKEKFNLEVVLSNLCCSGCGESLGEFSRQEAIAVQNAAVRTAPDGSDIVL